jgi:hypothetical protein
MSRSRRISDVSARRIIAVAILKDTFEDEKLLTARVNMLGEFASRRIPHD